MTAPAITISGQQSTLALAVALGKVQSFLTEPFDPTLCTEVLNLENRSFATADPTIQDIVSCDGRNLTDQIIRQWRGAFTIEYFATSRWLGWSLAISWGGATAHAVVGASNSVFTITLGSADAGTFRIRFDGKATSALAFNAAAAVIQTAVDAVIGAGKLTVAGVGTTRTMTAAGTYVSTDVRQPTLSTLKLTEGGGAVVTNHSIVTTTAGGPARNSYTLTQSTEDQPPAITAVLGYSGGTAWQISDLVTDSLQVTMEDNGLYRIRQPFVWNGLFERLTSFSWPACTLADTLETVDGAVTLGAASATTNLKELSYQFNNRLQPVYITSSKYPQAIVRQFPLTNTINLAVEEAPATSAIYSQVVANGQDGTSEAVTARLGSTGDGATLSAPESRVRFNGTVQGFGGTPALGRIPVLVAPFKSDGSSTKPVSATVVTNYAGDYLAGA